METLSACPLPAAGNSLERLYLEQNPRIERLPDAFFSHLVALQTLFLSRCMLSLIAIDCH